MRMDRCTEEPVIALLQSNRLHSELCALPVHTVPVQSVLLCVCVVLCTLYFGRMHENECVQQCVTVVRSTYSIWWLVYTLLCFQLASCIYSRRRHNWPCHAHISGVVTAVGYT